MGLTSRPRPIGLTVCSAGVAETISTIVWQGETPEADAMVTDQLPQPTAASAPFHAGENFVAGRRT